MRERRGGVNALKESQRLIVAESPKKGLKTGFLMMHFEP